MRARPYLVVFFAPVLAYLAVQLLVAAFVGHPSVEGWIGFGVVAAVALLLAGAASFLYPRTRVNADPREPSPDAPFRLLVVADAHCDASPLCDSVERELDGREAAVMVVAPVLPSTLHLVTDAERREREDARARLSEALQGLAGRGIEAQGTLGSDDPLQAIGDALAVFPAAGILLAAPEARDRHWEELDLEQRAREAYGVPVGLASS